MDVEDDTEDIIYTPRNSLFSSPTAKSKSASPFFAIITSTASSRAAEDRPPPGSSLHITVTGDVDKVEKRIRDAFAQAQSPDDIVLQARQGRAGTGALAGVEPKKAVR